MNRALIALALLAACGAPTYSHNGVPGAQAWSPGSITAAIIMTLLFVGGPVALILSSRRKKK